jgi:hypothetical protein
MANHVYEVRPRKDHRGVDLTSDAVPFGRLWYGGSNAVSNAIGYTMHRSRSHHAVIRVYDEAGNVIETHEHLFGKGSAATSWALSVSACNCISGSSQIFSQFQFHLDRCFKRHRVQMFVKLWHQSHA